MKKSQKGFIVPLLIVVVALLAIGGGVYVYEQNKPLKSVEQSQVTSNLEDQRVSTTSNQVASSTISTSSTINRVTLPKVSAISDVIKRQIQACDSMDFARDPIRCIENIAVKNNNPAICDELGTNGNNKIAASNVPIFKASCLGMVNKNVGYCKSTYTDKNFYSFCVDGVASANLDSQLCKQNGGGLCTLDIAIKTKNSSICSLFNDRIAINDCLSKVAVTSGDVSYCSLIKIKPLNDPYGINFCISDVARITNNRNLCNKITSMSETGVADEDAFVTSNYIDQCKTNTISDAPSLEWVQDYK